MRLTVCSEGVAVLAVPDRARRGTKSMNASIFIYLVGKRNLRYNGHHATMNISFKNNKEQRFYQDEKALKSTYDPRMARKIIQRIGQLEAAANPQHLPGSARFHEHNGQRQGLFSVDLIHPKRLIVRPTCKYESYIEITSVEIYEIMDPHQ
jgi:proteic killer suppression protein